MRLRAVERALFLSGICFLVGVVFLLASYIARAGHHEDFLTEPLRDLGILLISLGLISTVYEALIRRQLIEDLTTIVKQSLDPDSPRLGIRGMYRNRDEKSRRGLGIDDLIAETDTEMFCLGLGLLAFIPERQALIRSRIEQGCRFRFLIFNASSQSADMLDRSLGYGNGDLIEFIRTQMRFIKNFRDELAQDGLLNRFEVRTYDIVPTFGLVEINKGLPNYRMVVEINAYRAEGTGCPGFLLVYNPNGWSSFFSERSEQLWDRSTPLPGIPHGADGGIEIAESNRDG